MPGIWHRVRFFCWPSNCNGSPSSSPYIYMGHSPENWTKEGAAFPIKIN